MIIPTIDYNSFIIFYSFLHWKQMSQPDYTIDQRENMARIKRKIIEDKYMMSIQPTPVNEAINNMLEFPYTDEVMMDLPPECEARATQQFARIGKNPISGRYPFRNDDILFIHHKFEMSDADAINVQFTFYNLSKEMFLFQRFVWWGPRCFESYWFTMDMCLTKFDNNGKINVIVKYVETVLIENQKRTEFIRSRPALADYHRIYDLGTPREFVQKVARQYGILK